MHNPDLMSTKHHLFMRLYDKVAGSLGTKLAIPVITAVTLFVGVIIIINSFSFKNYGEREIDKKIERSIRDVEMNIARIEQKALWISSVCSELSPAREAYKAYYETGDLQESSKILEKELDNILKGVQRDLGTEARIHYHIPPATSFIRAWSEQRGDDVSAFRNTILEISETHEAVTGIEAGRGGFVIRALSPVFSEEGEYYGSVEILFPATDFINVSDASKNEEFALFMHTDMLEITTKFAEQAKAYNQNNENIFGNLIFIAAGSEDFNINNIIDEEINKGLDTTNVYSTGQYVYAAFPVRAYNGDVQGVGVLQFDQSDIQQTILNNERNNFLMGLALILLLAFIILRFNKIIINRPLKKALKNLDEIKEGRLNNTQTVDRRDEIGRLYQFISEMQSKLHEVVSSMRSTANMVVLGSNRLKDASEDISSGSAEQASSAEEIASSIEQMSANITQNRDNSLHTEKIVGESLEKIKYGTEIMKQTIEASNNVISKIGVVSEIAEKIDLLSINAGIQAAGGKGTGREFTVIANEIRALADNTARVADEINKLSQRNIELSDKTDKALTEIMPAIEKSNQLVKQISAAGQEQSHAADQINHSVQEFSNVTQRNANTSDNLLKEADKLANQAASLQELVAYFELENETEDNIIL